jgi:cellulose synthase/poly-beta-1,6-N-acetylglucosamine synthase-like glycosyltransferase
MKAAFWLAAFGIGLPIYSYAVYPVLLFLLAAVAQTARDAWYLLSRAERRSRAGDPPSVTLIIAAHDEETAIEKTVRGALALDYPRDRLEILIGSDGSTDRTNEIVRRFETEGVRLLAFPERRGKISVISDCAAAARGDILALSDANTLLKPDALGMIARHFQRPRIGGVCGELRLTTPEGGEADEGLYWRYEQILKLLESRLDSTLGANGAIYAVRRELFPTLSANLITDDFVIPMKVRERGFRVVYDPEAIAVEDAPARAGDEFRRRLRIGAGNWQALGRCWRMLMPWNGFAAFAFFSHKFLRWFAPFMMTAGFIANLFLLDEAFWRWALGAQVAFYAAAAAGWLFHRLRLPQGPLRIVWYFVMINLALGIGLTRGMLGLQRAAWQRTSREPARNEAAS